MTNHAAWTHGHPPHAKAPPADWLGSESCSLNLTRQKMLLDLSHAMGMHIVPHHQAMADILETVVASSDLLDGLECPGSAERYTRHKLYEGVGFSVLAVVWMPGQMSPVHSHRSWCALGVHRGELVETWFSPADAPEHTASAASLRVTGCRQLRPGAVSHSAASETSCHRMANLGVEPAISIHVYGVAFDRLGHDLNKVWAA